MTNEDLDLVDTLDLIEALARRYPLGCIFGGEAPMKRQGETNPRVFLQRGSPLSCLGILTWGSDYVRDAIKQNSGMTPPDHPFDDPAPRP